MKQIENTLQDLKCMLIEDGYTEVNIVMRTLIKAQEQVKNCSIPDVSNCGAIVEQDAKLTQEEIEEDCRNIPN